MKENLNILDSLQVLSFKNQTADFPIHYHETFCISLIQKGVFSENEFVAPQESILISHPYEIHSNKSIGNINISFSTFYISQDVVNFISPFDNTSFQNKIIQNQIMTDKFKNLIRYVSSSKHKENFLVEFYAGFYSFIGELTRDYGSNKEYSISEPSILLEEVKNYISNNLNTKIDLNSLAKIFGKSKYQFIRWFKSHLGITPFEYILLKRVEFGKSLIQQGMPLVDVSLDAGFYDQSHFSNYFKKYVGVTPKVYSSSCNIFQDN